MKTWKLHGALVLAFSIALVLALYPTFLSMVNIWMRSETFTHAFLIAPISLWLVWEKREAMLTYVPSYSVLGLIALFGSGFLWLLGMAVDAAVVQQFAAVLMLISVIWSILGNQLTWFLAFPLCFLLFMVPMGEDLVPPMMDFTANFTVDMVRLSGIPVYREGLFFMLPTGNWSVVEACSGIRYLIASITLGCLYAYVTYTKLWKRAIFIALSIIVPIIANGLRAYMIVMLGHLSDMTVATGVDHLVYGWLFFGVVIFILIRLGAIFKDPEVDNLALRAAPIANGESDSLAVNWTPLTHVIFIGCLIVGLSIWPLARQQMNNQAYPEMVDALELPDFEGKASVAPLWSWQPVAREADQVVGFIEDGPQQSAIYIDFYPVPGYAEMINSLNTMIDPDSDEWHIVSVGTEHLAALDISVTSYRIKSSKQELLVWSWYQVAGAHNSPNKYIVKLLEGGHRLLGDRQDSARITYAMSVDPASQAPELQKSQLQTLIQETFPQVQASMDNVAQRVYGDL